MRNDLKRPETTYNEQETTWNDPQRVRNNLQWPEPTNNERKKNKNKNKNEKRPTTSRFWDYFTIWGNRFSSLTHFPSNIWLQSFEHCFMANHGENRAPNICILSCVFITGYKIYRIRWLTFVRQKSTSWLRQKKSNFELEKASKHWKWLLGRFYPITLKNDWMLIMLYLTNWIERFSNLLRLKFALIFT